MTNKLTTTICPACLTCISSALTKKEQLDNLEVEVRELQMRILKLLENLRKSAGEFKSEVNKIGGIVEGSNVRSLDDFYCSAALDDKADLLKDAIQFREKVIAVFERLRTFNDNCEPFISNSTTNASSKEVTQVISVPTEKRRGGNNLNQMKSSLSGDEEGWTDGDNDAGSLMADDGTPDDDKMGTDGLDSDDVGALDKSFSPIENSPRPKPDNETNEESEDEDDVKFLPAASSNEQEEKNVPLLLTVDFSKMSTFKKGLVSRLIKRCEKVKKNNSSNQQNTTHNQDDPPDPRKTLSICYNPSEDNFYLCDVHITYNDEEKSLQCSKCDFKNYDIKTKPFGKFELTMFNHIVSHHLGLFSCRHCPSKMFANYLKFREHVLSHKAEFACEICGKPLGSKQSLGNHKWFHLSEDEKAEAVKNGAKPPSGNYKTKMEKKYQCSTCGKAFCWPGSLKTHEEEAHQSNTPHMCSQCGGFYTTRSNLKVHQKYVCYPDKGKAPMQYFRRFHCNQCPKTFRFQNHLTNHKVAYHSSEPPMYKCSLCDKAFRQKVGLKAHLLTHSNARPFSCKKGCGAAYKNYANCRRHEKICGKNK